MTSNKRLNSKNHPLIAMELVKFLAINFSFEFIDKVTTKVVYLEQDITDFKKKIATVVKSAASAANKADQQAKKQSDSFLKRLTKLEDKVAAKLQGANGSELVGDSVWTHSINTCLSNPSTQVEPPASLEARSRQLLKLTPR
jgi:ATPase subunit of ABC transporter with duplicated ATPase domains